jgi:starch synthase
MDIVFVSPEVAPFSKVGGLADVVAALPKALRALGHKVTVLSLRYGSVDPQTHALARRLTKLKVPLGDEVVEAELYEARLVSGVNVCLLSAPGISDRPGVYGENGESYPDNARRFGFLARAAVEWMRAQPRCPDIAHLHDWTTGLVPLFLREDKDPKLANVKTVFTLHNLAHQGIFPASTLKDLGIPTTYAAVSGLEFWGEVSWMKAAASRQKGSVPEVPLDISASRQVGREELGKHISSGLIILEEKLCLVLLAPARNHSWRAVTLAL